MKPLKILAFSSATNERIIESQKRRIAYLEDWLQRILVRDSETLQEDVDEEINRLSTVDVSVLPYHVANRFNTNFFLNEPDSEYKIVLANDLLEYIKLYFPNYRSELLESIASGESEYAKNFIVTESKG